MRGPRRIPLLAGAVAALVGITGCGGPRPPAHASARLVPADALVYLHLSTDPSRAALRSGLTLARRFPSFDSLRATWIRRLAASTGRVGAGAASGVQGIDRWVGREAALVVLSSSEPGSPSPPSTPGPAPTANPATELIVEVSDRRRVQALLDASPEKISTHYRGVAILHPAASSAAATATLASASPSAAATALVDRFLVSGPEVGVRQAIDLASGHGRSLGDDPVYAQALDGLPDDRLADGYVSVDGVRRVLTPRGGLWGTAGALLDRPSLRGVGVALTPVPRGARLRVHSILDRATAGSDPASAANFAASLDRAVPSTAAAYLGVAGLGAAVGRLIGAAGGRAGGLGALVGRARGALSAGDLAPITQSLSGALGGEVALFVIPHTPVPILAVIAHAPDEAATRLDLARLQAPLAALFTPASAAAGGEVPTFTESTVAGIDAFSLRLTAGLELDYAVFDHQLVLSTNPAALAAVRAAGPGLAASASYRQSMTGRPARVSSLAFASAAPLLALVEQTALARSPSYLGHRGDLDRVRAVGESSSVKGAQSTTEIFLSIP